MIYIASSKLAKLESITQVVKNSNAAIAWLEKHSVEFDRNPNGQYSLHLEGGLFASKDTTYQRL